jgi:hypothetical protein
MLAGGAAFASAQQQQPEVKVNVLHVCTPSADEQKELSAALAKIHASPVFGKDYEVARGHSTLDPNAPILGMQPGAQSSFSDAATASSNYLRVRHEVPQ